MSDYQDFEDYEPEEIDPEAPLEPPEFNDEEDRINDDAWLHSIIDHEEFSIGHGDW